MDFFQAQESARNKSKLLVFYFLCAVILIIAVVYVVGLLATGTLQQSQGPEGPYPGVASYHTFTWWRPDVFLFAACGSLAIIAAGSLFKTLTLRSGGGVVARSVGGDLVSPVTTDIRKRRLLNVVEEMAIASGVRVPEVYLLPEAGINAFAAGYSPDDAAVAVTEGALDTLTRDELQGVIAHEFSHILNGDMRLNIRLIGLLFGILLLAIIGRGVLHSMRFSRLPSGERNKNSGGIMIVMFAIGLALMVVGYVGVLFGRLIQAAVSRQREFLADASAVQFTRNPAGISGALKKIGGLVAGSRVANPHAAETSHLFFANALSGSALNLFATHPPLADRIRAIDPTFDGIFKPVAPAPRRPVAPPPAPVAARPAGRPPGTPPPLRPEQFIRGIASIGALEAAQAAVATLDAIPPALRDAAHDAGRAGAVVLALLVSPDDRTAETRQRQALLEAFSPGDRGAFSELLEATGRLPAGARLPLVDLALPVIRLLPPERISAFLKAVHALIEADGRTTLFEFSLLQVVTRHLRPRARASAGAGSQIVSFQALAPELSLVLGLIARAGSHDPGSIQRAFTAGASQLGLVRDQLALEPESRIAPDRLQKALAKLDRAAPLIKRQILEAMAQTAAADGVIMPGEAEALRAVAAAIDCPAPPLATQTARPSR